LGRQKILADCFFNQLYDEVGPQLQTVPYLRRGPHIANVGSLNQQPEKLTERNPYLLEAARCQGRRLENRFQLWPRDNAKRHQDLPQETAVFFLALQGEFNVGFAY
jgi:hypothetical protein